MIFCRLPGERRIKADAVPRSRLKLVSPPQPQRSIKLLPDADQELRDLIKPLQSRRVKTGESSDDGDLPKAA